MEIPVPLHAMEPVALELVCPECGRKVKMNPKTGDIYEIDPAGDDTVAHEIFSPEFHSISLVMDPEEAGDFAF